MPSTDRYAHWRTPDGSLPERATHVIAHLSDTHLTSTGTKYNQVLDSTAAMDRAIEVLRTAIADGRRIDAVVLSGDLTDTGDPDAYRRLAAAVRSLGGDRPPAVVYATGNHDVRVEFHRQLLARNDSGPVLQVREIDGLRILALDSTIPGAGHGRLAADHLAELAAELTTPSPAGSIVVLHHAPIPPPSPLLSYFALETASRRALAETIRGTDVRLVLAGHHHLAQSATLGGVPVAVAGSTTIRSDPLATSGHERTWASGCFNLVEVYPDTITVSVVPVDGAPVVFDLDPTGCADVIAAHPIIGPGGPSAGR